MNDAATRTVDIEALLDAMSLDEQVSLLSGADFWTTAALPRLGVPAVKLTDGPNGARGAVFKDGPSTACFPVGIALAATWDPALIQQTGAALGREARLKGARVLLAPTVNLQRTVYNGRNFECYSEDPWLTSELAVAYVRGVQSTGVAATIKHFVGNESEYQRMSASSDIPERALRELYLLPFERAVKQAGVMAVMTGYNRVGGTFMADHLRLVTQVLRQEWGFDGLVMTDWFASHDTVASVLAGCDLEMPGPGRQRGAKLVAAVQAGQVPAQAVRACARRVLQLAQRVGSFAEPTLAEERADDLPEHRALIRHLGAAAAVLLKNQGDLLPLALAPGQTVALIGWPAVLPQIMGGGSATVNAHYRVAPADALRAACPGVHFTHHPGADLHRYTPVYPAPVMIEFYGNTRLEGPVVATQASPNGETLWFGQPPAGVPVDGFSCRVRLRYVADADGQHAFSLVSAGRSRATVNGEPVLDAWTGWQRGDTYFTFGCDEVVHRRAMRCGDVAEIVVEYSSALPPAVAIDGTLRALRIGAGRELGRADIDAAVQAARAADVAIVFAGLNAEWDNEGLDRNGLALPHLQDELIACVAAANPRTVVVLHSGSPLLLPWLDQVPAVLQAWYPGQECGNAVADVLLGHQDPGGRLPQTWPARIEDTVAHADPAAYPGIGGHVAYREGLLIGYRHHDAVGAAPLFAFGHGLSYTQFEWQNLRLEPCALGRADPASFEPVYEVSVDVCNTGLRAGATVVQLYLAPLADVADVADEAQAAGMAGTTPGLTGRPAQSLVAFGKVHLGANMRTTLRMAVPARAFAGYDTALGGWQFLPGAYELRAATSATGVALRARLDYR